MKKAYVFPGQGSQFPGMAKALYEGNAKGKELLEKANDILGFRITDIMFEGTPDDLKATRVTQPAIFLHSVVLAKCYEGFRPDMVAGHSLGEFSALAAAEAISFEDALRLVYIRATQMQLCCEKVPGTMAAIVGLPDEKVEEICSSCEGIVIPANYNCGGQVVISGEKTAVEQACEKAKVEGAKRALPLAIYQNVSAQAVTDPQTIKKNLLAQLTSPVRWTQSVRNMLADGADYFMEIGPGTVLQGLVKRISAGTEGITIEGLTTI